MGYRAEKAERIKSGKMQEMKRLQRKLIPVNLIVCLLCIIALISLLCTPFLTIDLGKITADESVDNYVKQLVREQIVNNSGGEQREGESSSNTLNLSDESMAVIVNAVVEPIFGSVHASVSLTPKVIFDVAFAEHPGSQVTDLMIIGEHGLVVQVADSLAKSVRTLGGNKDVTTVLQEAVVDLVADELVNKLPEDYGNIVSQHKDKFKEAINSLDNAQTEDEAVNKVMDFLETVDLTTEDGGTVAELSEEQKTQIEDTVRDMYQTTVAETRDENGDNFTVEGLICVMASDTINKTTDGAGLAEMIKQMLGDSAPATPESGEPAAAKYALTENAEGGNTDGGATEGGTTEGGTTDSGNTDGGTTDGGTTEGGETTDSGPIYTTYETLFASLISEEDAQEISDMLVELVRENLGSTEQAIDDAKPIIIAVFCVLAVMIALWAILFLFSFIHIFTKNKRFTMWYVKLFAPYPAILFWLVPLIAPYILPKFLSGDALMLATAVLSGISSLVWISGLCYLVLWAVSICWAFPIKRKIRRLKKELKYAY